MDQETFCKDMLKDRFWRVFTADTDEDDAAEKFRALYGAPPERIREEYGILLVGPVPEGDNDNANTHND